ncbi:hypothetical protein [Clostridium sp.]|uniref:hypothetical protein n=1 Tax=Clostridium sp. TaxID=1506 RepID=UPI003217A4D0
MTNTKVCIKCGKEKSLREFAYHSKKCHDCNPSIANTKRRQQIYKIMKEWDKGMKGQHKDGCNNDCDRCGFHPYCQKVLDVFDDTNWSEGEG